MRFKFYRNKNKFCCDRILKARDKQKNKPHDFFDFMRLVLCLYANMI